MVYHFLMVYRFSELFITLVNQNNYDGYFVNTIDNNNYLAIII